MRFGLAVLMAFWVSTVAAQAEQRPVVVELFTSQGCSACPPADEILMDLANRDDVLALGLHVDYWDYLGWEDGLGRPQHSARQRAYSIALGQSMIYTPQMVIDGRYDVVGSNEAEVLDAIDRAQSARDPVMLTLEPVGERMRVIVDLAEGAPPVGRTDLVLVRWIPQTLVEIGAGENQGTTVMYVNAVTRIEPISGWNGDGPMEITIPASGESGGAILVQRRGLGPVLAAAAWPN